MLVQTVPAGLVEVHGKSFGGKILMFYWSTFLYYSPPLSQPISPSQKSWMHPITIVFCVWHVNWLDSFSVSCCFPVLHPQFFTLPSMFWGQISISRPHLHMSFQLVKDKRGFYTFIYFFFMLQLHKCTSVSKIKKLLFPGWIDVGVGHSPSGNAL